MLLNGITVNRPEGTKLIKRQKTTYVYKVIESIYDKEKQYNIDKRKCIGKMVEGSDTYMIPNNNFFEYYPGCELKLTGWITSGVSQDKSSSNQLNINSKDNKEFQY